MAALICYCFKYTESDIRKDVYENNGQSLILEKIAFEKKRGTCQCSVKNPSGK